MCCGDVHCTSANVLCVVGVYNVQVLMLCVLWGVQCTSVNVLPVVGRGSVQFAGVTGQDGLQPLASPPPIHPSSPPTPCWWPGGCRCSCGQQAGDGRTSLGQRGLWCWTDNLVMTPVATCLARLCWAHTYATAVLGFCVCVCGWV